jgi:pyruvate,water dikinase
MKPRMRRAFNWNFERFGLIAEGEDINYVGSFYGRVFGTLSAFRLTAERSFLTSGDAFDEHYMGRARSGGHKRSRVHGRPQAAARIVSRFPASLKLVLGLSAEADRLWLAVLEDERRLTGVDWPSLSDEDLEREWQALTSLNDSTATHHILTSGITTVLFEWVRRVADSRPPGRSESLATALFTGLRSVESAEIASDLWRLRSLALKEPDVEAALRAGAGPNEARAMLLMSTNFGSALRAFVERHGHRGVGELEVSSPSWRQRPDDALRLVASYLDAPESEGPLARLERSRRARREAERELYAAWPFAARWAIRWLLRQAQRHVALRERTKSIAVRAARRAEPLIAEFQARLLERGALRSADDLFFLTVEDLKAYLHGKITGEQIEAAVTRRRVEHERNRGITLPEYFLGRPAPLPADSAARVHPDEMHGIAVSAGKACGRARVITDPATTVLEPGEILVAPITDAGWTPLFANAAALVVDTGGVLSHGSTVAREYGIPAVVAVKNASSTLTDGQWLEVDGSAGTVRLVDDPGEKPPAVQAA